MYDYSNMSPIGDDLIELLNNQFNEIPPDFAVDSLNHVNFKNGQASVIRFIKQLKAHNENVHRTKAQHSESGPTPSNPGSPGTLSGGQHGVDPRW